jgi:succinoglycan biosynthesis protein ExoM
MANKYTTDPAKISIAICTRERPIMLTNLLKSFEQIEILQNVDVEIDIIENHTEANLAELIAKLAPSLPFKINHHWEPKIGIPIARNHALRVARESGATHIIFIDDDERVAPQWLKELWNAYLQYDENTIIQGAVISAFESDHNAHLQDLLQRKIRPTGDHLDTAATNNVIICMDTLSKNHLHFDASRPLAGGTDSKMFREAHLLNIPLIFCAEAIVYEDIPKDRINMRWISRRYFRVGLTYGEFKRQHNGGLGFLVNRLRSLLKYSLKIIIYAIAYNPEKLRKRWIKLCLAAGQILGFANFKINSYEVTTGS